MPNALRAILYLRQSTFREESISLELQETAGRDYCERKGYTVIRVEQDPGISGRTWNRPAVQRVMAAIEDHDAEVIVLWRWSRLSRSRKDWALAADRVDVAGGRIESATEPNDVTAAGRFARGVMTELAAFESERIGEQWKEVHQSRIARGLPNGRTPWGWIHQDGEVVPHPENSAAIPRLYEMYLGGMGGRQLATWLEDHRYPTYYGTAKWNYSTVTAMLASPFHAGLIASGNNILEGSHEGVVPRETWERYMAMRVERKNERATLHRYLLSGILTCGCGSPLFGFAIHHGHRAKNPYFGYRCKAVSLNKDHGPGTVSSRIVDEAMMKWLRSSVNVGPMPVIERMDSAKIDARRLAREITALDGQIVALTRQLGQGLVPERAYKATVDEMESSRAALVASLAAAEHAIVLAPVDAPSIAREMLSTWAIDPLAARRAGIRSLISSAVITFGDDRTLTITPRGGSPVSIRV